MIGRRSGPVGGFIGVEEGRKGAMDAVPPHCRVCGQHHHEHEPHDATTSQFMCYCKRVHGVYPHWHIAMSHCHALDRMRLKAELESYGIDVDAGQLTPTPKRAGAKGVYEGRKGVGH